MPISFLLDRDGTKQVCEVVAQVTINKETTGVSVLATEKSSKELQEAVRGGIILGIMLDESIDGSLIYEKDSEGRVRVEVFSFFPPILASAILFDALAVEVQTIHNKPVVEKKVGNWKWSGNIHGH